MASNETASGKPLENVPDASGGAPKVPRLASLDAYRGFIMLMMASAGFHVADVAEKKPASETWRFLAEQTEHVAWRGCSFWDLIQPSFMFMVGVAMAYSYSARQARGQSYRRMLGHAVVRSLVLVLLAVFLASNWSPRTDWIFTTVLAQIGLGYTFLFLLWNRPAIVQLAAALLILLADWGLFVAHPAPPENFEFTSVGVPAGWQPQTGLAAHWDKNTNVATAVDRVVLNWFPRETTWHPNDQGYTTLNFVPSLATMIFGLVAGGLMRGPIRPAGKLAVLVVWGGLSLAAGWALDRFGVCPSVKRIWTPSWALFSTGWTLWFLAAFYALFDMTGWRRAALPLAVVGMNSIVVYCMSQLLGNHRGWTAQTIARHFGEGVFTAYGRVAAVYEPIGRMVLVLTCFWLVCVWLYRSKLFIRI